MMETQCTWSKSNDLDDTWETQCGGLFCLSVDGPAENDMKFCCYCGGKLIESVQPDELRGE